MVPRAYRLATKRDLATLQRWFEFSFHSMIVDVCDDVLEHEEL